MKTQNPQANGSGNNHKKKVFGIQRKLLCIILPLFLLSFVVTSTLIFVSSAQTILSNSKRTLEKEAVSNMKTVSINLLQRTGSTGINEAYGQLSLRPTALQGLYDDVADIRIMDTGYACLVDTRSQTILAHGDSSLTGTVLSDYDSGTFLGDLGALVSSGSTSISSISDGMEQY